MTPFAISLPLNRQFENYFYLREVFYDNFGSVIGLPWWLWCVIIYNCCRHKNVSSKNDGGSSIFPWSGKSAFHTWERLANDHVYHFQSCTHTSFHHRSRHSNWQLLDLLVDELTKEGENWKDTLWDSATKHYFHCLVGNFSRFAIFDRGPSYIE